MTKRIMAVVGIVAGAVLLAACSSSSSVDTTVAISATTVTIDATTTTQGTPEGGEGEVSIENFAFGPGDITVSVGDTVTWTNLESSVGHTTTSDDGIWASEFLTPGDTFEVTFDEVGTFTYFCSVHPSMTATITVNG